MAPRGTFLVAALLLLLASPQTVWSDLLSPCGVGALLASPDEEEEDAAEDEGEDDCPWFWEPEDGEAARPARREEALEERAKDLREKADELRGKRFQRRSKDERGRGGLAVGGPSGFERDFKLARETEKALQRDPVAEALEGAARADDAAKKTKLPWHRDFWRKLELYPANPTRDQKHRSRVQMSQVKNEPLPPLEAYHRSWVGRREFFVRQQVLPKWLQASPKATYKPASPPSHKKAHRSYPELP